MKKSNDPVFAGYYPLIPDGEYDAVVIGHEKKEYYTSKKLYLKFRIFSPSYISTEIFMPFNMPGNGRVRPSSKYCREWMKANGGVAPKKRGYMSPKVFTGKPCRVRTRTVKTNSKQVRLSGNEYSVVDEIKEFLIENPGQQYPKTRRR